jgi:5'-methylthioadenosine phosphorylase
MEIGKSSEKSFMRAEIAIIGGSGIYSMAMVQRVRKAVIKTPYGRSPELVVGELEGKRVVFIPRHGEKHEVPPHRINYRANLWALGRLGVTRVLATTASGTLNPRIRPGDLALLTQFLDFTKSRPLTFHEGGRRGVVHVDMTEPYCPELRVVISDAARGLGIKLHRDATYACMEGPRFETSAEIRALRKLGSDLVGMTNIPECVLARELGMCYAAIGIITNYAAGISRKTLSHAAVLELMKRNAPRTKSLLVRAIRKIPEKRKCFCAKAAEVGRVRVS